MWQFKEDFPDKKEAILNTFKHFDHAFEEIKNCKSFKKMLGYILSIGNILNGGTNKGQADGFYLEALSKTTTLKDVNNKTILHFICEKMKKEDEEFVNFKNEFKNVYVVAQHNLKDEDTKVRDIRAAFDKAKTNFEMVLKNVENLDTDIYCEKISEFIKKAFKDIELCEKKFEQIKKDYASTCEYFMIDKTDEKASNS